jgi:hypothetical protein
MTVPFIAAIVSAIEDNGRYPLSAPDQSGADFFCPFAQKSAGSMRCDGPWGESACYAQVNIFLKGRNILRKICCAFSQSVIE